MQDMLLLYNLVCYVFTYYTFPSTCNSTNFVILEITSKFSRCLNVLDIISFLYENRLLNISEILLTVMKFYLLIDKSSCLESNIK